MYLIKAYFILGLAMCLVVLWDYKYLRATAAGGQNGFFACCAGGPEFDADGLVCFFPLAPRRGARAIGEREEVSNIDYPHYNISNCDSSAP